MSAATTDRVSLLLQQKRPDLAEQEARRLLQHDPEDAYTHGLLAMSLLELKRPVEAQEAAQMAVALEPAYDFGFYLLSLAHVQQHRPQQAMAAIEEALSIDPEDANYHHLLGQLRFQQNHLRAALQAAETGLASDPTHVDCLGLRARCLARLGRRDEASADFAEALRYGPTDTGTHADLGWVALERGRAKEAAQHFREALRLNPTSEYAREGLVASLKARFWLYNGFFRFMTWTQTLSNGTRTALFIGMFVLARLVPALLPLYLAFVGMSWFAEPLFNTLLRFSRDGRLALSAEDTQHSNIFTALVISGVTALSVHAWAWAYEPLEMMGMVLLGLLFPVAGTYRQVVPHLRRRSMWFGVALAVVGLLAVALMALGSGWHHTFIMIFLFGTLAYIWGFALQS
ncbi:tetratricopeptide repeat protein [Hymenobacter koreensis]|uniref:Tetratricopeptide repeat protein n=1 Tax=Hymenobacter koreensis TaxID=1084523 RepID=A0ABP8ITR5_9BACT